MLVSPAYQKLYKSYCFAKGETEDLVSKILHAFYIICNYLSDYCESDIETNIVLCLAQKLIQNSRTSNTIDEVLGNELGSIFLQLNQIYCV